MTREIPSWLNKDLYPFESRWLSIDGDTLHYLDEGKGDVILFAHGTPEWSFGYRDLIKELRQDFRCISIDMLGFGLSDKPTHADYSCQAHAARLTKAIELLNLQNMTIVANDFGGGIALAYAIENKDNVRGFALFNTWMWSLKEDKHYAIAAKALDTWFGRMLYLIFNAPVNLIMPAAYGNKKLLTPEVHAHYRRALPKGQRAGAYAFVKELMRASPWWQSLWQKADVLRDKEIYLFWGLKDKFVPAYELEKWKAKFHGASVMIFEDAGHFLQEEKPAEITKALRRLMRKD